MTRHVATGTTEVMKTRSRTSVVIGTYNGAAYIGAQLESLAAQTVLPHEIIVSDDGSTDDTVAIVEAFAARSPIPMTVRCNAVNLGFGENFLQAAKLASGDYIAFCDQDDIWRPRKIERCQEALVQPGVILAVHVAGLIDSGGAPIGTFPQRISDTVVRQPLHYGPWDVFFGFSMVFNRRLLDIVSPDLRGIDYITGNRKLAHDRWILFLANLTGCTTEIAEPLADYRQHGSNLFGSAEGGLRKARVRVTAESDIYLQSAREQRTFVDLAAASQLVNETKFDHDRAAAYWDAAVAQQKARNALYSAGSLWAEWQLWLKNLYNGVYSALPTGRLRIKAALRDLRFIVDGAMS
jgi:glycosyltransferase involved in cell wall biosynthesis